MHDDQESSVEAARAAAERDQLGAWVERFLASPGSDNADLAGQLSETNRWWTGPLELRLDQLHRLAGPAGHPVLEVVDDDYWRDDLDEMVPQIERGWEPPPVIVTYRDDQLVLEDGNHRVEGLRRAGREQTWAVVGFQDEASRDRFAVPDAAA